MKTTTTILLLLSAMTLAQDVIIGKNINVSNKPGPQSTTSVAVDPTDTRHILYSATDNSGAGLMAMAWESFNGGKTFSQELPFSTGCLNTWLVFNLKGTAFLSASCFSGEFGTVVEGIASKKKGQSGWTETFISPYLAGWLVDHSMVSVDNSPTSKYQGSVYVGYDDLYGQYQSGFLYSRDGGQNWHHSTIDGITYAIGIHVATGPDGTVYATWEAFDEQVIFMARSTDGGRTWSSPIPVADYYMDTRLRNFAIPPQNKAGILPIPMMAIAPVDSVHAGRLYVSYLDEDPEGKNTNVYALWSDDAGETWSHGVKVNDDKNHAYHFNQSLAVAPDGTVEISFYDTRRDPSHHKVDRYTAISTDGGETWINRRVTTAQSDETGANADPNQYGDYEGDAASPDGRFWLSWTDSRPSAQAEDVFGDFVEP